MDGLTALAQPPVFPLGLWILLLTLFLDALDLSFARILWFLKTLRFWLYFALHFGLSCLSSYLLAEKVQPWWLLGIVGTFLGVAVLSNADIKIGGLNLIPIAQRFGELKNAITAQAAQDKAEQLERALLIERLQRVPTERLEAAFGAAALAAKQSPDQIEAVLLRARQLPKDSRRRRLIHELVRIDQRYATEQVAKWAGDELPPAPPAASAPPSAP